MSVRTKGVVVGLFCFTLALFMTHGGAGWAIGCDQFAFEYPINNANVHGRISAGGHYQCKRGDHVWIVSSDGQGYYLQNPEVLLYADGKWEHNAVNVGRGIKAIIAVLVTQEGHNTFMQMARDGEWGQFRELPRGSVPLTRVNINSN